MANRKHQLCENCGSQSLMTVLNKFVEAVNSMDDKVMVPSRLRDMEPEGNSNMEPAEENNNMSLMPLTSRRGEDMYSHFLMINAIKNEVLSGNGVKNPRNTCTTTTGFSESDGESDTLSDDSDDSDDAAGKIAHSFRHHLQGLFGLLHQLTDTANFLGDAYEGQVGGKKAKKFAI